MKVFYLCNTLMCFSWIITGLMLLNFNKHWCSFYMLNFNKHCICLFFICTFQSEGRWLSSEILWKGIYSRFKTKTYAIYHPKHHALAQILVSKRSFYNKICNMSNCTLFLQVLRLSVWLPGWYWGCCARSSWLQSCRFGCYCGQRCSINIYKQQI